MLEAEQRQAHAPLAFALLAIGDIDARVAIVVARDVPREAKRDESGRVDNEFAGVWCSIGEKQSAGKSTERITTPRTVIHCIRKTACSRARLSFTPTIRLQNRNAWVTSELRNDPR